MGNKLFGVDISGLIAKQIGPGVLPATLTKFTDGPAPARITDKGAKVPAYHTCRGFWEDYDPDMVRDSVLIKAGDRKAILIGDTIQGGVVPEVGDTVTCEGKTLVVIRLEARDPAAATYTLQCRDRGAGNA